MINVSSNLALFGPFDSFTATSKACVGMVWTLLRVHEVHSTLTTTWPYLCTFSKNNAAILVFNTVFSVLNSWTRAMNNNNARVRLFGHLTTKNYIGLTEGTFKQRFSQHKSTFKHRKHINSTELSKYIWQLHDKKQDFNIKWSIMSRATSPAISLLFNIAYIHLVDRNVYH